MFGWGNNWRETNILLRLYFTRCIYNYNSFMFDLYLKFVFTCIDLYLLKWLTKQSNLVLHFLPVRQHFLHKDNQLKFGTLQ